MLIPTRVRDNISISIVVVFQQLYLSTIWIKIRYIIVVIRTEPLVNMIDIVVFHIFIYLILRLLPLVISRLYS